MADETWQWSALSRVEVRDPGRAVVKAAMERAGFATDQDGSLIRGHRRGELIEVHVRTLRTPVYSFWEKKRFLIEANRFAALVLLRDGEPPAAYLVPANAWLAPNQLVVSRDYEGLASEPEWGLNLSGKTLPLLENYRISRTLSDDAGRPARPSEVDLSDVMSAWCGRPA
jgi:hypothetical protein